MATQRKLLMLDDIKKLKIRFSTAEQFTIPRRLNALLVAWAHDIVVVVAKDKKVFVNCESVFDNRLGVPVSKRDEKILNQFFELNMPFFCGIVDICISKFTVTMLTTEGKVISWGHSSFRGIPFSSKISPVLLDFEHPVVNIRSSYSYSIALQDDNQILRWGYKIEPLKVSLPSDADPKIVQIEAAPHFILIRNIEGRVFKMNFWEKSKIIELSLEDRRMRFVDIGTANTESFLVGEDKKVYYNAHDGSDLIKMKVANSIAKDFEIEAISVFAKCHYDYENEDYFQIFWKENGEGFYCSVIGSAPPKKQFGTLNSVKDLLVINSLGFYSNLFMLRIPGLTRDLTNRSALQTSHKQKKAGNAEPIKHHGNQLNCRRLPDNHDNSLGPLFVGPRDQHDDLRGKRSEATLASRNNQLSDEHYSASKSYIAHDNRHESQSDQPHHHRNSDSLPSSHSQSSRANNAQTQPKPRSRRSIFLERLIKACQPRQPTRSVNSGRIQTVDTTEVHVPSKQTMTASDKPLINISDNSLDNSNDLLSNSTNDPFNSSPVESSQNSTANEIEDASSVCEVGILIEID